MLKYILFLITQIVIGLECLYDGDSCTQIQQNGICTPLPLCKPMLAEIERAGKPMPMSMRIKLQRITCGFHAREPMGFWGWLKTAIGDPSPPYSLFDQIWQKLATASLNNTRLKKNPLFKIILESISACAESFGETPKVCCLGASQIDDSENTMLNPVTTTNRAPMFNAAIPTENTPTTESEDNIEKDFVRISDDEDVGPKDVSKHPNLSLLPTRCGRIGADKILNGQEAGLAEMPWMVVLSYISRPTGLVELNCAGTLINEWYVLTTAHCVTNFRSRLVLDGVILGEYDFNTDPDCGEDEDGEYCVPNARNVTIDKIIPHPEYSPNRFHENDIALLRLSEPADLTLENIKPICLPVSPEIQNESLGGKMGTVSGWGRTESERQSSVLLKVDIPIMSLAECIKAYSSFNSSSAITNKKLCAGGVIDTDSCSGDSGGPLIFPGVLDTGRNIQRGIISFGTKPCGIGRLPSVHTNVAYYMDWILDNITS